MGDGLNRRQFLQGTGAAAATAIAGCLGDDDSDSSDGYETDTPTGTPDPEPRYELVADVPEETDLTSDDYAELEIYVERTLGGETEPLTPETADIEVEGEAVRDHPDYSQEFLKDAGLHTEINELEHLEDRLYRIAKTDLLAGNNQLSLEIQYHDPEHGKQAKEQITNTLQVQKNREETQEDTWINDEELYDQLRQQQTINELERGAGARWDTWKELIEDVEVTTEDRFDLEELDREETLHRYAYTWIDKASDVVGGGPSGQANFLAAGLEHILDNVTAGRMNNTGHNTVILHHHNEEKTYHVETGRGGITVNPPAENGWTAGNPDKTPLWETENNLPQAASTLEEMVKLASRFEEYLDDREHEFGHNITMDDDFLVNSMTAVREDTDAVPGLIDSMQELALTTELSPSINYEATGTAENPEFTPV